MAAERKPVRFSRWRPVARDQVIGYSYIVAAGPKGARKIVPGMDRWMRAKSRLAASAIATGVEEFHVWGGVGRLRWERTVLCSEDEAREFFEEAIRGGGFMLKGQFRKALVIRERRLEKAQAAAEPDR